MKDYSLAHKESPSNNNCGEVSPFFPVKNKVSQDIIDTLTYFSLGSCCLEHIKPAKSTNRGYICYLRINSKDSENDIEINQATFEFILQLLSKQGSIFYKPSSNESRILNQLHSLLGDSALRTIPSYGWFIGDLSQYNEEHVIEKHKRRNKCELKPEEKIFFSLGEKNYSVEYTWNGSKNRTYFLEAGDDSHWLRETGYALLKRLAKQPGRILLVERTDKRSIEELRRVLGQDFIKTIPKVGIYIGELSQVDAEKMKNKTSKKRKNRNTVTFVQNSSKQKARLHQMLLVIFRDNPGEIFVIEDFIELIGCSNVSQIEEILSHIEKRNKDQIIKTENGWIKKRDT